MDKEAEFESTRRDDEGKKKKVGFNLVKTVTRGKEPTTNELTNTYVGKMGGLTHQTKLGGSFYGPV